MPLSWNEIRNRSYDFIKEWEGESRENAEAKSFWDSFFNVFGVSRRRVATFEQHVKTVGGKDGFIDLLWKGILLIEHKSEGKDLDKAHSQAKDYFGGLKDAELPQYILVSDFARFRLYDLEKNGEIVAEFKLKELPANIKHFGFLAGYQPTEVKPEDPVNIEAAEKMGLLHDKLKEVGYSGHNLERYLVRLLFCLFAEDTGIFERNLFRDFIQLHTKEDGSDLGANLGQLFHVLNTPHENRLKNLPEQFSAFEYVNGELFAEVLSPASFDSKMRGLLLDACVLHWGSISPGIFGSLFQSVMDPEERRNLGAHYTEEKNILKLIKPLFLDELYEEFRKCKGRKKKLERFHQKLEELTFFDPACGCGNFLVVSYRELRLLELEVIKELNVGGQTVFNIEILVRLNIDKFYGIEIEEFPAQIAQVAMWLVDHQMNLLISEYFGLYYSRLPLKKSATIVHGNALEIPWGEIIPKEQLSYILGNPPYVGSKYQDPNQRKEMRLITEGIKGAGILDYVTAWYFLAARYIQGTSIAVGFVSTNSISQGEQVGVLWSAMFGTYGVIINFAHRTFQWSSKARGKAAVHVVIIGFSLVTPQRRRLFEYSSLKDEPHEISASNINPYLVDGPSIAITNRSKPICDVPKIGIGNKPIDGGHYLFTTEEKRDFIKKEPDSEKFFSKWVGSYEFLNNKERWCLWLGECPPDILRKMPACLERIQRVKEFRLKSKSAPTQKLANTPTRFHVENMPKGDYLLIPEVSSERRNYIPTGFLTPDILASNLVKISSNATLYHFGVISSKMHMAWMRYTAGRLKSDYRYSSGIVYNNFPWPKNATEVQKKAVEKAAQDVIDAREQFPDSSLADLYDPLTMPPTLVKAHQSLDRAVDKCYRSQPFTTELNRIEFLFNLYEELTRSQQLRKGNGNK